MQKKNRRKIVDIAESFYHTKLATHATVLTRNFYMSFTLSALHKLNFLGCWTTNIEDPLQERERSIKNELLPDLLNLAYKKTTYLFAADKRGRPQTWISFKEYESSLNSQNPYAFLCPKPIYGSNKSYTKKRRKSWLSNPERRELRANWIT